MKHITLIVLFISLFSYSQVTKTEKVYNFGELLILNSTIKDQDTTYYLQGLDQKYSQLEVSEILFSGTKEDMFLDIDAAIDFFNNYGKGESMPYKKVTFSGKKKGKYGFIHHPNNGLTNIRIDWLKKMRKKLESYAEEN